jgi:aminoglycoside 6'-N-acetyltransferase
MSETPYLFRRFMHADLAMAARWLRTPEIVRWWGNPDEQEALLAEDLDQPLMRQWIVELHGQPLAYAQAYPAHAWPQSHLVHLRQGTVMIDKFIGEPGMLGGGHGRRMLRQLASALLAEGAPMIGIDPSADNLRAQSAYRTAGFGSDGEFDTPAGRVVVMRFPTRHTGA